MHVPVTNSLLKRIQRMNPLTNHDGLTHLSRKNSDKNILKLFNEFALDPDIYVSFYYSPEDTDYYVTFYTNDSGMLELKKLTDLKYDPELGLL